MSKKKQNALQQALAGRTSIGPKAIANIKAELGIKGGVKSAAKDLGIKIKSSSGKSSSPVPSSFFGSSTGSTPAEFDFRSALNLINAQGNIDTEIARLNSEAASNVAKISAKSDAKVARVGAKSEKYQADRGLEAALGTASIRAGSDVDVARLGKESEVYKADRDLEAALGVENIRSRGAIDLQKIMNEGNERVESIRGTFGLKGKGLDRGSAILSALSSAFNF
jgi:hypothetical protein